MKKIYFLLLGLFLMSSIPFFANTFSATGVIMDDGGKKTTDKATTIVLKGRFIKQPERSLPLAAPVDAVFVENEGIYLNASFSSLSDVTVNVLKDGCVIYESFVDLPADIEVLVPVVCSGSGTYVLPFPSPALLLLGPAKLMLLATTSTAVRFAPVLS